MLLETNSGGNNPKEFVFFNGTWVARRDPSGSVFYYFEDHLGSSRVIADSAGNKCYDADFYPFGGERSYLNNCPPSHKFTGQERDSESISYDQAIYFFGKMHRRRILRRRGTTAGTYYVLK